jgi:hypothetical protein
MPAFKWRKNIRYRARAHGFYRQDQSWSVAKEDVMGFGRGALLWLIGIPLPIIILLALFWHR